MPPSHESRCELYLHAVVVLLLWRVGHCRELGIATASGADVLLLVHMDSALGAVGPLPTRPEVLPWRGHLSGEKAMRELGYRPRVTYEEALAETERYLTESVLITR